jgi:hypothetical protein
MRVTKALPVFPVAPTIAIFMAPSVFLANYSPPVDRLRARDSEANSVQNQFAECPLWVNTSR